jgi:succinoglycan biosynthesis transport protein ExoP
MNAVEPEYALCSDSPYDTEQAPPFNALRLIRRLISGLPIVLLAAVLGAVSGFGLLRALPRSYTSSVSILLDPKRPGAYGADTEFGNSFVDVAKIADVELVLVSSPVLLRVVQDEQLASLPAFGDASPSLLERILPAAPEHKAHPPETVEMRENRAIRTLRRMIRTARVGATYVVNVDVTAPTAEAAQQIASDVAHTYIAEQSEAKYEAVQHDTALLTQRVTEQRAALTRSSGAVEALRQSLGVASIDAASDSTVDRASITDINRELTAAEGELASAQAHYTQALRANHGGGADGLSAVTASPAIAALRARQSEAAERLANLSVRYAADYPERKQAERDVQAIDRDISAEISRTVSALRNDYQTALMHRDVLKQQLATLVRTVNAAASAEGRTELQDAERVAAADKLTYEASLAQLREVQQQQDRQDVEARIISGPDLPDRPSAPKPLVIIGATTFLAMMVAAAGVLAVLLMRVRVDNVVEAEQDLALPMLASIPYLTKLQLREAGIPPSIPNYLAANPYSMFAESFRVLRLRLAKTIGRSPSQVVQITSAVQGEGKSAVATSLAISAATSGIRTVLVDLDLYNPEASRLLEFDTADGVVELLNGSVAKALALRSYRSIPLRAITAGSIQNRNPSLIESEKLQTLIAELREEFDLIILDTPPVLAISDPLFVAQLVDATVMVIAWRATPQALVAEAIRALRKTRAPLAGLLLNKVHLKRSATYRYGYYTSPRYRIAA